MTTSDRPNRQTGHSFRSVLTVAGLIAALAGSVAVAAPTAGGTAPAAAATPDTSRLVPVGPIRLADTRLDDCGCEHVDASTITIDVAGQPAVPDDAVAVAITVTALPSDDYGHITVYPDDQPRPTVSTVNTRPDRVVANSAIVPLGSTGVLAFHQFSPGDVVVDLTAAFVPATSSREGRFVAVAPRRLADTRTPDPPSGALAAGGVLSVPLPAEVEPDATAVVVNVTSVLEPAPGHLSARPAVSDDATTSFLNLDGSGSPVAATVIVPVDAGGFEIESYGGGHVIVDFAGWFTGPGAPDSADGLFVPFGPTRLLDTRLEPDRLYAGGTIELDSPVTGASAIVTNLTVTLPDRRGHVTAYPARTALPDTSSVNPAFRDHTVANLAITSLSTEGIAYRSHAGTDLVVDMTGWFTGTPLATTTPEAPNLQPRSRALMIGDSTLAGLDLYRDAYRAFVGFDMVVDAKMCRRLLSPSCKSYTIGIIPNTAVEAIAEAPGRFDIVIIKTGYNDSYDFVEAFEAVVNAARAKGAHTIVWLTYNDYVHNELIRKMLERHNRNLSELAAQPRFHDVIIADWKTYSGSQGHWFWDGIHMLRPGAWAQADYVSRFVAHLERRPCPRPWVFGEPIPDPCPRPEWRGPVPNAESLY